MEIGAKTIAAGVGLFLLGVGSTYWLMADNSNSAAAKTSTAPQHQPAMHAALTQLGNNTSETAGDASATSTGETVETIANTSTDDDGETLTHESFLAAAEARREQQLAEKAEADRLNKLRQIKADSVDCKFWRQQQKNASAAAKIEEKIKTHCMLASDLPTSASSSSAETI